MVCPNCGKMVPEGNAFCVSCGASINGSGSNNQSADFSSFQHPGQSAPGNPASGQGASFSGAGGESQQGNSFGNPFGGGFGQSQNASFAGFESNPQTGFGGFGGEDSSPSFGENPSFAADNPYVNPNPIPDPSGFPATGSNFGQPSPKKGLPKPALIAIIVVAVLLVVAGGLLIANHLGVIHLPFLPQSGAESLNHSGDDGDDDKGGTAATDADDTVDTDTGNTPAADVDNPVEGGTNTPVTPVAPASNPSDPSIGNLSVSATDVEPPELGEYQRVAISGIEAAPGTDGTAAANMLSDGKEGWKIPTSDLSNSENKKIRLTFNTCGVKVIEIKAGSWTSPEDYNSDARPTKIYLKLGDYDYPLSLNDVQKAHYIVLSNAYETSELTIVLDSISNGTTGKAAITGITLYSE